MLGDISYHKVTLQSEGKQSIHIHIHIHKTKSKAKQIIIEVGKRNELRTNSWANARRSGEHGHFS